MSDHEWCRDTARDEAIRAAEDAAAVPSIQHRDLPEQVALLWASLGDIIGRVVRLEGEMDAGQDEEAAPAEGMRKERGESVRVVEDDLPAVHDTDGDRVVMSWPELAKCLTAERDAAIRERDEARDRVAELEAAAPPRGWMTAEEREAVDAAADAIGDRIDAYKEQDGDRRRIEVLDGLLARETPPRVKVPDAKNHNTVTGQTDAVCVSCWNECRMACIAAIRAAGGEVD